MSETNPNDNQGSFWATIPGILTALATLITALAGLHVVLHEGDTSQNSSNDHAELSSSSQSSRITQKTECLIKGNISSNSGDRIYHMPGDRDYEKTQINTAKGERFFCTEAQAQESGWRRAPN
ncbi:MAG: hypothetical protein AAGA80_03905 [Cyanobacteria bacterium P01_F01_bin.143]